MSSIEIEAKTTQEAIEKACKHFHLSEEELDIEVLEDRSTGIFGIVGNKKAKIRVTPKKGGSMAVAQETLKKIISLISADTRISAEKKGEDIILNIEGNNTGILIGHKGKTLEALEFIVNKAVNKASEQKVRVIVDSENYRKRREESLKTLAFEMGEKAKKGLPHDGASAILKMYKGYVGKSRLSPGLFFCLQTGLRDELRQEYVPAPGSAAQHPAERSLLVRQRQEVQEVLSCG